MVVCVCVCERERAGCSTQSFLQSSDCLLKCVLGCITWSVIVAFSSYSDLFYKFPFDIV